MVRDNANLGPGSASMQADPSRRPSVSVVIPCLNEADTIAACVANALELLRRLPGHGANDEVIVADNASTDGSARIASAAGARVVAVEARGYGAAIMGGVQSATSEIVVIGDADLSYDFTDALGMIEQMSERPGGTRPADIVVGNRFEGGIANGAMAWHRRVGNRVLSGLGRRMFRVPVRDFHCGLRAVRREAFLGLDIRTDGMEFASEMIVRARVRGLRITEHPVTLRRDGRIKHGSHLRPIQDGWRHVALLISLSPRWALFMPGLVMMSLGLVLLLILLPAPRVVMGITLDVHTLTAAALMTVLGYQAVVTGAIVRLHGLASKLNPPPAGLVAVAQRMTLGRGMAIGASVAGIGGVIAAWPAIDWAFHGFGPLEPRISLRPLLAGVTLAGLGGQTLLGSILLALLAGITRRRPDA